MEQSEQIEQIVGVAESEPDSDDSDSSCLALPSSDYYSHYQDHQIEVFTAPRLFSIASLLGSRLLSRTTACTLGVATWREYRKIMSDDKRHADLVAMKRQHEARGARLRELDKSMKKEEKAPEAADYSSKILVVADLENIKMQVRACKWGEFCTMGHCVLAHPPKIVVERPARARPPPRNRGPYCPPTRVVAATQCLRAPRQDLGVLLSALGAISANKPASRTALTLNREVGRHPQPQPQQSRPVTRPHISDQPARLIDSNQSMRQRGEESRRSDQQQQQQQRPVNSYRPGEQQSRRPAQQHSRPVNTHRPNQHEWRPIAPQRHDQQTRPVDPHRRDQQYRPSTQPRNDQTQRVGNSFRLPTPHNPPPHATPPTTCKKKRKDADGWTLA